MVERKHKPQNVFVARAQKQNTTNKRIRCAKSISIHDITSRGHSNRRAGIEPRTRAPEVALGPSYCLMLAKPWLVLSFHCCSCFVIYAKTTTKNHS